MIPKWISILCLVVRRGVETAEGPLSESSRLCIAAIDDRLWYERC